MPFSKCSWLSVQHVVISDELLPSTESSTFSGVSILFFILNDLFIISERKYYVILGNMASGKVYIQFILLWVILIVSIALLSYLPGKANPIVRPRLEVIEPFTAEIDPEGQISRLNSLGPADATLDLPRRPYALLVDSMKTHEGPAPSPTSKSCYEADFQNRVERTGNFRQLTNNYKRGVPDSCSAPNHDLSLAFYKVDPLPAAGCL